MSGHKDRVQALALTTLDLGHKLDGVIGTQAQHGAMLESHGAMLTDHGAAIARLEQGQKRLEDTLNANHLDLNAKLNLILSKLG
jgi:hypothetical protein